MNILKHTIGITIVHIFYAPIWWYSKGLVFILQWLKNSVRQTWRLMSIEVWIQNLLTPMFQQYDWQGRIISFFMRLMVIIFRTIGFTVIAALLTAVVVAWIVVPAYIFYTAFEVFLTQTVFPR